MKSKSKYNSHPSGSGHRSLMPFKLPELEEMSILLRNACIGMIQLAHPESRPIVTEDYFGAMTVPGEMPETDQTVQIANWTHLFKVRRTEIYDVTLCNRSRRPFARDLPSCWYV